MYLPKTFALDDTRAVVSLMRNRPFGHLVTATPALESTAVPFVVDDDLTEVRAHVAKANDHWRTIDGAEAMLIVSSADAYISPSWYPSKAADARVVPTWNYELIHLHATVEIVHDNSWKLETVTLLTDLNESRSTGEHPPWSVDDAPHDYIDKMLSAIVGVHLRIDRVVAKRKLSQNKPDGDRLGAADGLLRSGRESDREVGSLMRSVDD